MSLDKPTTGQTFLVDPSKLRLVDHCPVVCMMDRCWRKLIVLTVVKKSEGTNVLKRAEELLSCGKPTNRLRAQVLSEEG
jgi:hypothetical protein